jgi:hypothetical protein
MTVEQALAFLDSITANLALPRQQHAAVVQALETLKKAAGKNT